MALALVTNYLTPYRMPLYELLAERHGIEVLCYGGGERYVPSWFADLDGQLGAAPFPARRLGGPREALGLGRDYEVLIAPFAGGAILPALYAGARRGAGDSSCGRRCGRNLARSATRRRCPRRATSTAMRTRWSPTAST